ncbi:MAG: hypothetical protein LBM99_05185 [Bacillales bacterium]|jgi:hypothetical protein|nr:hypothetical protein [Bacillales bacterium]
MKENKFKKFFATIGRGIARGFRAVVHFIKLNAWIQPLLVVGAIFALIFALTGIPKLIDWIKTWGQGGEEKFNFNNSKELKKIDELKWLIGLQEEGGSGDRPTDFILIFTREDCANCKQFAKLINQYQASGDKIENLYVFDVKDLSEKASSEKESESLVALSDIQAILEPIVEVYAEQSGNEVESWPSYTADIKHPWYADHYSFETPTTVFYKDGAIWSVTKGAWVSGKYNFTDLSKVLGYWKDGDIYNFKEFFKYQ